MHKNKPIKYQDYVIKDGELVGDWEGLYRNIADPWHQSRYDQLFDSRRIITLNWCNMLRQLFNANRVIELGCGFGHLTSSLQKNNFTALGVDISQTAIEKAKELSPDSDFFECAFNDFEILNKFDADIYLMAEITWYVLEDLDAFIENLKEQRKRRGKAIFLIHLLTTYQPGFQKYGTEKFTNLEEILQYFKFDYLEAGFIRTKREEDDSSQGTYFIGKI